MLFKKDALTEAAEAEQLRLFSEASGLDPDSKEFAAHIKHINDIDSVKVKASRISKDAVLGGVVNILGILVVLNYEKSGAIVSKAFSIVKKA